MYIIYVYIHLHTNNFLIKYSNEYIQQELLDKNKMIINNSY